jgi:hypothetical protein
MISGGENSLFILHSSLAILPLPFSRKKGDEGNYDFGLTKYLCSYLGKILNMP